ncbi:IS200/IS605 family transposase [Sphingobacterium hungaricum]|uniref:Transposase n=1 Tax=Sphingobacterium hungaricum TaxID=2082723 RepID=A0A928YPT1_9SPHI|nr:IS200/IS605 family transposase [Sphingobacterium hungaricum]MBE8713486.1 transposase [Sphingobacterium hungaricum]
MANTYSQLYVHFVFAVKYREATIGLDWEEKLHKYITGIIQNQGHKLLAINSASNHIHLLIVLNPTQAISDLMRIVKSDSSEFVNKERFTKHRFQWQEGYGAFSYSRSQIDNVVKYILNQKEHHKKVSFQEEYRKMLKDYSIDYDDKYVFKDLEG